MAVDEASAAWLAEVQASGVKPIAQMTVPEARENFRARSQLSGPGPGVARVADHAVAGPDGAFTLRVLVPEGQIGALIVYYHGGGWVIGDIDGSDALVRTLANRLHAAVVNVDYRLAPEHRYPAAAQDAWAALQWAGSHAGEIAGARVPIVVMGDSAGGNLAAVVAQKARDAAGPALAGQVLVYPVTDCDLDKDSYLDPENQLLLTRESMAWFWDHYAPEKASRENPDASPLRAPDLAGLPPAIVLTAEHDPLRDEGEAYAARLAAAGVPVRHRRFPGQMHGFFAMLGVLPGSAAGIDYVAENFGHVTGGTTAADR